MCVHVNLYTCMCTYLYIYKFIFYIRHVPVPAPARQRPIIKSCAVAPYYKILYY